MAVFHSYDAVLSYDSAILSFAWLIPSWHGIIQ